MSIATWLCTAWRGTPIALVFVCIITGVSNLSCTVRKTGSLCSDREIATSPQRGFFRMLFEEALQLVGDFGVFQYLLIVYLCVFVAPLRVLPLFAHIFSLLEPPHWCRNPFLEGFNFTRDEIRNMSIPKMADGAWSKCTMYNLNWTDVASSLSPGRPGLGQPQDSWPTVPCEYGWEYDHSVIYPTVVSEMDWVCGSTWKAYVSNSVFFGCMSFGVITFGAISDKVGRVPVMVLVYILAGAGAVVTYFSNNFAVFVVTRAIEGAVLLSISIIPFVLAVEYVPAQKRMLVLSAFRFAYPLLGVCMPWVAYAVGHWRLLNAVVVVPCILGPLMSWFIPESTRWLIAKGNIKRTKKILQWIAKVNGKQVDPDAFDSLQMDWVCGSTWKAYVSNSVFFGCMSFGVITFGAISDKVGRVPVMVLVYILAGAGAVVTYFSNNFAVFVVTRAIEGAVLLSISIIPFVLAVEYVPAQKRMLVLSAFRFAYPLLGVCMPWVAYAVGHWRLLNAVVVVPCILGPLMSWFIPESTRWLIAKGNIKRTKKILQWIAKVNGKQVDPDAFDSLQFPDKSDGMKKTSTMDVFRFPTLRRNFLITLFLWLLSCLTYSAGQLYAATATDDPFVMTSTTNAMDILATGLALPLADRWGRRPSMMAAYTLAALCYLGVAACYGKSVAIFAVMMVGRFALTTAYNVGYLYAAEIYPTEIRSQALSIRQAFGSLGKFLSSQVVQLAFYGKFLPLFILGGMSCVSSLLTFPLPETNNQRLPETLEEGEDMRKLPKPWFPCLVKETARERRGTGTRGRSMSTLSAATIDSSFRHGRKYKVNNPLPNLNNTRTLHI
ncbi:solute carrier family 22 member 6 [Ixodes scapularis]